ncbi:MULTISPECIES: HK97 family phage prohead protease [Pseudonocardia]|uniref:Caudovirus prohead protease n=2 Tax=Pseudonocardia TaxID=1847 RepID=A0A1Y2N7S1_PSEAH|nr:MULTISPECIES: HK97 family phage prohead protease [Pseudonocardia]OSY42958.1 Caudovirus prohead protease [Pseudonocardia autotrophica]TDN77534.1 HK97 family phage prohead protease [Pseudonocardia autotrophica]BBG01562.1 hypothetical protein Pdca_27710 [Pseudonocardia autotrophica]GEC29089.1 hypothetical protein PSA01_61180 [Pseudonocardia saturnea]
MQVKTCPITVKTAGTHEGAEEGIVEAIVAAYNVDSVGDQIVPGAFGKSLARHKAAGNNLPFVWSHQSDDPDSYIGEVLEAEERPEGLWVKARLDMDEPKAAKVYRLLKGRRVSQFSFAYTEIDARPAGKNSPGALKELHELDIHECGPTMVGANPATALLGVKATKTEPCPTCGHATGEKHTATPEAPTEPADSPAEVPFEDRVQELVKQAVQDFLRESAEADTTPVSPTESEAEEATPAEPANPVEPPAAEPVAAEDVPASEGTADVRLLTELDLLEVELDMLND